MLDDIKNTIKQSAIYGLSRVSAKLIAFILLPLYSSHFSIFDYGIIVRIETLWQILWSIFLFGLESGVVRWYSLIVDENKRKKYYFTVTIFLLVINVIFTFIFYYLSGFFSLLIFQTTSFSNLVFLSSLIASTEAISFLVFLLIRIKEKPLMYSIFAIIISMINLILQYYFIVYSSIKLEGVFISKIIAPAFVIILLLPYYIRNFKIGFETKILSDLIKFSFPVMLSSLAGMLLIQVDRYILGYLTDSGEVGVYGLGNNICGIINFLIIAPFSLAFTVLCWKKLNEENAKRFFTKSVTYLFFVIIYSSILLSFLIPYVIKVLPNQDYWLAKNLVPWLSISMSYYGISIIGFFSFYVTKRTHLILITYLISLAINIIINFSIIPYFKMYGAVIANFAAYLTLTVTIYIFSRKEYFFRYEWKKIFYMTFCAFILMFPFFFFHYDFTLLAVLLKIIAIVAFPFILLILRFYEPIEIETIKRLATKYLWRKK